MAGLAIDFAPGEPLWRHDVSDPDETRFQISEQPEASDVAAVADGLLKHNETAFGPSRRRGLSIVMRGPDRVVQAGLIGRTAWGWLFVENVWVCEDLRGRGIGRALVERAETEARARGCTAAWLDTFNPQAFELYRRMGYEIFGRIDDYVESRARFFMRKVL